MLMPRARAAWMTLLSGGTVRNRPIASVSGTLSIEPHSKQYSS
jgi:hypothetical protein